MTKINDGGSAFPLNTGSSHEPGAFEPEPGMSLRDWFAGQALAGLMATCDNTGMNGWLGVQDQAAAYAYAVADALLAARSGWQDDD